MVNNAGVYACMLLQKSSILPQADRLGDVDYLLIHGTGDGECSFL